MLYPWASPGVGGGGGGGGGHASVHFMLSHVLSHTNHYRRRVVPDCSDDPLTA